jgi:nucleotide-binding universal stress UspA family protein
VADHNGYMVVGLDGSPGSARALAWADAHVDRFGPIVPVATWQYPWWALAPRAPATLVPPDASEFHQESTRVADQMVADLDPTHLLEPIVTYSEAGPALVTFGSGASLIVVGTRGRGALVRSLLGSVSSYCVTHSRTPVAVIPSDAALDDGAGRVVVGIDGSDNSVAALTWALANTPDDAVVEAVLAWDPGTAALGAPGVEVASSLVGDNDLAEAAAVILDRVLGTVGVEPSDDGEAGAGSADGGGQRGSAAGRRVRRVVERGDPRQVLLTAAEGADLLVVGARGRQHLAYLLLGSVASALVHHAVVPTVVVRA